MSLFARKSIDQLRADAFVEDEHSLKMPDDVPPESTYTEYKGE